MGRARVQKPRGFPCRIGTTYSGVLVSVAATSGAGPFGDGPDSPVFAALWSPLDAEVAAERLGQEIRRVEAEVTSN